MILGRFLKGGGWIEVTDIAFPIESEDGSIQGSELEKWSALLVKAGEKAETPIDRAKLHRKRLLEAGFEEVVEKITKWP